MYTSKLRFTAAAILIMTTAASLAQVSNPIFILDKPQPKPGWGTTSVYNVHLTSNGVPIKNKFVTFFFTNSNGVEGYHYGRYTNPEGRATYIVAIPKHWKGHTRWVRATAICGELGIENHWRVK